MAQKILSQTGVSLADIYDVEGSIVGVDELDSEAVKTTHEMGATIQSERVIGQILELSSTAVAQSIEWDINFSFAENVRIGAVVVVSTAGSRVEECSLAVTSPPAADNSEVPFWIFDSNDNNRLVRILVSGSVLARAALIPLAAAVQLPQLLIGQDSRRPTSTLTFRGTSTAFGAGTVTVQAMIYAMFAQAGTGDSSYGLPVPW